MKPQDLPLSVFRHLFASVAEEMGEALRRAAISPNIKERRDYSCALLDARGRLISHAAHIPVHLGSAHLTVPAVLKVLDPGPGDVVVLNDPHRGGTHLNDVTVLAPLFVGRGKHRRRLAFLLNRAHHADVGGIEPGSLAGAKNLAQEGVLLGPMYLQRRGVSVASAWRPFGEAMRDPTARIADLQAQCAALHRGGVRMQQLRTDFGSSAVRDAMASLHDHGARLCRTVLRTWPDREVQVQDRLDGKGTPLLRLRMIKRGARLHLDFTGTSPQVEGSWNTHRAVVWSAVFHVLRCVSAAPLPETGGVLQPLRLTIPRRSLLASRPPAGVAVGNTETSQRLADLLLRGFAQLLGRQVPAASQGTMNNLCFGGTTDEGADFVHYETLGGGAGAGPSGPGASAIQVHMTNTRNTPVEVMEQELPVRVIRLALRNRSGGAGKHRGGDGLIKEIEFLQAVRLSVIATRRQSAPSGVAGGKRGQPGRDQVRIQGHWRDLNPGEAVSLQPGDRVRIQTPGGGGWGLARA